jgi:hypothetical protein
MQFAIRIDEESIDFIAKINGGLAPKIEEEETFFIVGDDNTPNEILTRDNMVKKFGTNYETPFINITSWK